MKTRQTGSSVAYSYVRFSSAEQALGASKQRQMEAAARYAARHGLELSDSTFADLGVSAWSGRNASTGALAAFLDAIEAGRVPAGSTLIVESLDRLTRQAARKALRLIEQILEAGIDIVTLQPERRYTAASIDDPFSLMELLFIFVRSHEESEIKSKRIKDSWKRRRAKGLPHSACPSWLRRDGDKWAPIEQHVETMRRILALAADGLGGHAITKHLNERGVINPASGKPHWPLATIRALLRDRRLIGEYQPCEMQNGKHVPIGEPIKRYYPQVVPVSLFRKAQAAITSRRRTGSTKHGRTVNLFSGLLVDPLTQTKWIIGRRSRDGKQRLITMAAYNSSADTITLDCEEVERTVLSYLADLQLERMLPGGSRVEEIDRQLLDLEGRIAAMQAEIGKAKPEHIGRLVAVLAQLEVEYKQLQEEETRLFAQRSSSKQMKALIKQLREPVEGDDRTALRLKLRSHLATIIESIELRGVRFGRRTLGVIDVVFPGGQRRREITHKQLLPIDMQNRLLFGDQASDPAVSAVLPLVAVIGADRVIRKSGDLAIYSGADSEPKAKSKKAAPKNAKRRAKAGA